LQQDNAIDENNEWTLFSGASSAKETLQDTFSRIVNKHLNIELKNNLIFPIYDYMQNGKNIFIVYAHVSKLIKIENAKKTYGWFTFKQIQKLKISEQAKQDIIIGQRVIDSSIRKVMGLRTIG
jgi:hypothetical protein